MGKMETSSPLSRAAGTNETDQVERIFSIMGQPNEQTMPGCTAYANYERLSVSRFPLRSRLRQASARGQSHLHIWSACLSGGPILFWGYFACPAAVTNINALPACVQHCDSRGVKDPRALDLLEQLLALNPAARIKAEHAVTVSATPYLSWLRGRLNCCLPS